MKWTLCWGGEPAIGPGVGGSRRLLSATIDSVTGSELERSLVTRGSGSASALGASAGNSRNVAPFGAMFLQTSPAQQSRVNACSQRDS